jgi:hypothetical protein
MHSGAFAQDASRNDTLVPAETKQYRTALLMKQSQKVNQSIENFFSEPNPKTATYLALFPGLGQIYNRKYWKLPIVYAGFGVIGYFAFSNRDYYLQYKDAYTCKVNLGDDCEDPLAQNYTAQNLQTIRDGYRRNMELSFIIMGVWYILQMLDATVDAHLYYWEIDETTTLHVMPNIEPASWTPQPTFNNASKAPAFSGFTVSLKF